MSRTDFEDRAYRRRVGVLLVSFLCALPTLLAVAIYLVAIYFLPTQGWLDAIMFLLQLLPFLLAGAGGIAIGMTYVIDLPDLLRGRFRCERCGRAAGRMTGFCRCDFPAIPHRPRRYWTHYRRRLKTVLMTHIGLVGIVLLIMASQSGPRHYPFVIDVMIGHAALAALLGVLIHLAIALLETVDRGRRFRLRATVYGRVLVVWPLCVFVVMAVLTGLGVT